ncbi:coagulation factor X-like [Planococcus citri]|uniref:coagulation factor X-like n=1 Tax=Planococcus citri TaxID=170843 RepID=UPI0031FA41FC
MRLNMFVKNLKNIHEHVLLLLLYFHITQINCVQSIDIVTPVVGGNTESIHDSPWHVAIFNQKKILICGGTIIRPQLILSAAHCFYDDKKNRTHNASDFEIIVSKFTRNYSTIDNQNQKIYKIKQIRLSEKGYADIYNNYAADIGILILEQNITFNTNVAQAHVDWESIIEGRYPAEGIKGKVAGWGCDETGKYPEKLQAVWLPFISRARCLTTVPVDARAIITFDKFCAGSHENGGPSVLQGDSGGGIFFQKDDKYYLRGIVSVKQASLTSIAAFTDLSDHARWILSVIKDVEKTSFEKKSDIRSVRRKLSLK